MENDKKFAKELLEQNGIQFGKLSDTEREGLRSMIAREKARVRRMKWAVILSWVLVAVAFVVMGFLEAFVFERPDYRIAAGAMLVQALLLVAIIFTISFYVRWRSASMREIQSTLANIQKQLEHLRKEKAGGSH